MQKLGCEAAATDRSPGMRRWGIIILAAILLFHFANNFIWLKKDNFIIGVDGNWHIIEAVKFHIAYKEVLQSQLPLIAKTGQWIHIFRHWPTVNWPPLVYFFAALLSPGEMHLFELRMYAVFIFFVILVLSTYFLGKKCFNRRSGLIAAFLISFYPAVTAYSRFFGLDFPLMALTSLCVCLQVYSENFSRRSYALLLGFALGLGMLVKLQILIFLAGPLLYAVRALFFQDKDQRRDGYFNFLICMAIAFGISFYMYWGNRIGVRLENFREHVLAFYPFYKPQSSFISAARFPTLSSMSAAFYLESLLAHAYLLPFLLFLGGLVGLFVGKNKWRYFFLFSFLFAYFTLSFISVKSARYALPLLTFMAVTSGWWIDRIPSRYLKGLLLCALVFYSVQIDLVNSWSAKRCVLVPRSFLKLTGKEISLSNPFPPLLRDNIEELRAASILSFIERQMAEGKTPRIEFFIGRRIEDPMAWLYFYFQNAVLNGKIVLQQVNASSHRDADGIFIREADLPAQKDLLKNYRVSSKLRGGSVFLIK